MHQRASGFNLWQLRHGSVGAKCPSVTSPEIRRYETTILETKTLEECKSGLGQFWVDMSLLYRLMHWQSRVMETSFFSHFEIEKQLTSTLLKQRVSLAIIVSTKPVSQPNELWCCVISTFGFGGFSTRCGIMLGALKTNAKARAAREARFVAEAKLGGVLAPQTKVMAHPESIKIAGDATAALLHVCRKRLASGADLTSLQLAALVSAGADVDTLKREALATSSAVASAPAIYGDAHGGAGAASGSVKIPSATSSKSASASRGRDKDKSKERKASTSKSKSKSSSKVGSKSKASSSSRPRSRSRASAHSDSSSDAAAGRRERSRSTTKRKRVAASDSDD